MTRWSSNSTTHQPGAKAAFANASLSLVDFLLPPACAFCTRELQYDVEEFDGITLCEDCRRSLTSDERSACIRCGLPVGPYVDTQHGCPECSRRGFRFNQVIRLGVYEDSLKTACIRGKFPGAEALAAALAALLCKEHLDTLTDFAPDVVVSVPQFWLHRFTRPHHQAMTMAEVLAERLDVPHDERAIQKVRHTVDQSSLPKSKRVKNLQNAFQTGHGTILKSKRVLIVDDIMTTGTTSNEVAKVARKAGASAVAVAVIAVVP